MTDKNKPPDSEDRVDHTVFRPAAGGRPKPVSAEPEPAPADQTPADQMPQASASEERTIFQPLGRSRPVPKAPANPPPTNPSLADPPLAAPSGSEPADSKAAPALVMPAATTPEDHTMIRPNPGGRRPPPSRGSVDRIPQMPSPDAPRRATVEEAEIGVLNADPIMRAASPLLLLLGRLRASLSRAQAPSLVPQIVEAVQKFEAECVAEGVVAEATKKAKYILCATADEVIANLPGGDRVATQASVTSRFFGESPNVERFFDEPAALKADPNALYPILQLQHACLALGFAGHSRTLAGDGAALPRMQHEIYEKIARARPRGFQRLSPHWKGQAMPAQAVRLRIPFWAVAGIVGLGLFVLYLTMRSLLALQAEHVAATMASFNPAKPIEIRRQSAVPPPQAAPLTRAQSAQLARIRKILGPNITDGTLAVIATANQIIIRIPSHFVFQRGKAALLSSFRPLALYIALALDGEKGPIKVLVHTDDRTAGNDRYGSNFELSSDRAQAVGAILKQLLAQPERVKAEGKGSDVPIASNATPQGRAENRRVEVVIGRSD
jgi:type VI secretion system protein ImpK